MDSGLLYAPIYGLILAFSFGPVFFTLIETSITKGFRAGLSFDLGAMFADIIFLLIAIFSTSKILDKLKDDPALYIFGGVLMLAYGIITYVQTSRSIFKIVREHYAVVVKKNLGSLFLKGFLLNFVNFGVLAGWIGILIIATTSTGSTQHMYLFLTIVLVTFFSIDLLKILLAKKLKSRMTPRFIISTKRWISILIMAFGVLLLLQGIFFNKFTPDLNLLPSNERITSISE
ncbi:MAG TPA: LysE family transporter [Flavobacteriaceae bacterium]|nr:LysE family transporter [Flavobacteriaceae bacterium]